LDKHWRRDTGLCHERHDCSCRSASSWLQPSTVPGTGAGATCTQLTTPQVGSFRQPECVDRLAMWLCADSLLQQLALAGRCVRHWSRHHQRSARSTSSKSNFDKRRLCDVCKAWLVFSSSAGFSRVLCKALEQEPPALSTQHLRWEAFGTLGVDRWNMLQCRRGLVAAAGSSRALCLALAQEPPHSARSASGEIR
jgi:hypothetical protein